MMARLSVCVATRRNVPLNSQLLDAVTMSGIITNFRASEGFWAFAALITLIIALVVAVFGFIFLSFDQVVGVTEVLVLLGIACSLQAIYYQRKVVQAERSG